jgi:hypothetical protein
MMACNCVCYQSLGLCLSIVERRPSPPTTAMVFGQPLTFSAFEKEADRPWIEGPASRKSA